MLTSLLAVALLQSELVVNDLKIGKGPAAKVGDLLTVCYKGTLLDGTVFDENLKKAPFAFSLGAGHVIKGWDQGLVGMKVGGKRTLTIPPSLGYGDQPNGNIPADSTLQFEVVLLRIDAKDAVAKLESKTVKKGSGAAVKLMDRVTMHYTGSFVNGVDFDSSRGGDPVTFTIKPKGLIPGFIDALVGMKKGERKMVTIPWQLAYGEGGRPPIIPAKATLKFDIEVVEINPE